MLAELRGGLSRPLHPPPCRQQRERHGRWSVPAVVSLRPRCPLRIADWGTGHWGHTSLLWWRIRSLVFLWSGSVHKVDDVCPNFFCSIVQKACSSAAAIDSHVGQSHVAWTGLTESQAMAPRSSHSPSELDLLQNRLCSNRRGPLPHTCPLIHSSVFWVTVPSKSTQGEGGGRLSRLGFPWGVNHATAARKRNFNLDVTSFYHFLSVFTVLKHWCGGQGRRQKP